MTSFTKIPFRVSRDLGQIYNTAFKFIRQNRSVLFKSITFYIMPFILLAAMLLFTAAGNVITTVYRGVSGNWLHVGLSVVQALFGLLIGYLAYATYITLVYEYMKLYHESENPQDITHQDVWKATKKRFFLGFANVLIWGILVSTLTGVVLFLFYLFLIVGFLISAALNAPWLIIVFYGLLYLIEYSLVLYIQVFSFPMIFLSAFERIDVFTAFGKSFSMVNRKTNFWNAIGVTVVGGLIMFILRYITLFPATIIGGIFAYNSINPNDMLPGGIYFKILVNGVLPSLTLLYFYTFVVYLVAEGFESLSLDERVSAKGLLNKIEKIGTYKDKGPEYYEVSY